MSEVTERDYLLDQQYVDSVNLQRRIDLHARFSTNRYGWFRWVFDHIDSPEGSRLLELGCGQGDLWAENLARLSEGWMLVLSDFSPKMLATARKKLLGQIRSAFFCLIDAQSIPYPNGCFDVVIANHMLYHVPQRDQALFEIQRILQPGGRFYATTIGERHMEELALLVKDFDPKLKDPLAAEETGFTLENGVSQLKACFSHVERHRYEDMLVVTQAEPLVDYVLSSFRLGINSTQRAAFADYVEQHIQSRGELHMTKDSGLFICWN